MGLLQADFNTRVFASSWLEELVYPAPEVNRRNVQVSQTEVSGLAVMLPDVVMDTSWAVSVV